MGCCHCVDGTMRKRSDDKVLDFHLAEPEVRGENGPTPPRLTPSCGLVGNDSLGGARVNLHSSTHNLTAAASMPFALPRRLPSA
jgi:hypothetical protein